jgi:hypothetical protein
MAISTPGMGKNNGDLERRIANLERNLNAYAAIWVTVGMPGGDGTRQQMQVLAKRGSPVEGGGGPFEARWNSKTDEVTVAGGSYHYLNTNTDVPATSGTGTYVYAVIKRLSRWDVSIEFSIEVTSTTKDPTNLDSEGEFIEFSNVLLAEVIPDGDTQRMVQRRAGNFSMINQTINGYFAIWPLSSGGTI